MSDDWRTQVTGQPSKQPAEPSGDGGDGRSSTYQAYWVTPANLGPQQTVQFRLKTGAIDAFEYAHLERLRFEPGKITLHFTTGKRITIEGQFLNDKQAEQRPLYDGLCDHVVTAVAEIDPLHAAAQELPDGTTLVTAVTLTDR